MIDISVKKEVTAWVDFSDDESYLIKFYNELDPFELKSEDEVEKLTEKEKTKYVQGVTDRINKINDIIRTHVLDWKGIYNGDKPLECTDEIKKMIFSYERPEFIIRRQFVVSKISDPVTFLDSESLRKN